MDISTLSQQLNISITELRRKMAQAGFRVSPRARKIDNSLAREVMEKLRPQPKVAAPSVPAQPKTVYVSSVISVRDFASSLNLPATMVIKTLIQNGVMASLNEQIDFDTAAVVGGELGFEIKEEKVTAGEIGTVAEILKLEKEENLVHRPPIVAVMGHVDHGKTKLLDTIRSTNVIDTEAGAITQHIGAYKVEVHHSDEPKSKAIRQPAESRGISLRQPADQDDRAPKVRTITFLDTPGHEAFAAMRARGANVTDLIILVVAADDGVKPQTLEVINRSRITNTPMIVAINKIDKPEANPELIKGQLAEAGVQPEEWGGKTIFVPISAKQNIGVDKLLDMILLSAEMENFRANPQGTLAGTVIEAHLSKTQGPVASVIIQNGTLRAGDIISLGSAYGRTRALEDETGKSLKMAGPSAPVRISGLAGTPEVGDLLRAHPNIQEAQAAARKMLASRHAKRLAFKSGIAADVENQQLNLIIKADAHGSLEAIMQELQKLENPEVKIKVVAQGVGDINESDVLSAESSKATLIGFHNSVFPAAVKLAQAKKVNIDIYEIIYELTEDITKAILKLILPEVEYITVGKAKILAQFLTGKDHMIVGGVVVEGKFMEGRKAAVMRADKKIGEGKIAELQRNKMPTKEVKEGEEFGVKVATKTKIERGDFLLITEERMKEKKLKKV